MEDRRETGDVRRRHRGAADRDVALVDDGAELGAGRAGGGDVDAGGDDLGLHRTVAEARAAAGEGRHLVVHVDGADGEGGVGRPRRGDRRGTLGAVVAGCDDEQAVGGGGQLVDRLRQRVRAVVGVAAEAHADDVGVVVDRPDHAGEHPRVLAVARVGEHLADEQLRARCHPLAQAGGGRAAARDGRGDVRPVPVAVGDGLVGGEVRGVGDQAGEVGVGGVVARVQHRDGGAGAVEAGVPGLGRVDLRDRVLQRDLDLAVEVDPDGAVGQGRRVARVVGALGEVGPEGPGVGLLGVERGDAQPGHRHRALGACEGRGTRLGRGGRSAPVVDHHGQRAARGVVVRVFEQPGHVEEVAVEPVRGQ